MKLGQWCENGGRADHRGHGEPGDAQRGAQRDAAVRPHQGLREARARAPASELCAGQPRGAAGGAWRCSRRCSPRSRRTSAEELWVALGNEPGAAQTPWPGVSLRVAGMSTQTAQSPVGVQAADALVRDGSGVPPLREQLCRWRTPCSRARTAARGSTSSTTTSWRRATSTRFPSSERPQNIWHFEELLPIVDAGAQARVGQHSGYTPLIRADRLGAELGIAQPVPEGRLQLAPEPLLQGPRRVDVGRAAARAGQERDRLRLDRQRRHGGRLARREGGRRRLRLLPQPPRGHQGARLHGARREGLPGRGQLRRSQPPLPRSRRSDRHGLRQHHAAPVLRRGRQDGGVRDRRAARLAARPTTSSPPPPAARSPRACTRA